MKRNLRMPALLALALALATGACSNRAPERAVEAAPASSGASPAKPAVTSPVSAMAPSGKLQILSVLSVEHAVDLLAQRDGVVQRIYFDQDSWVNQGAVMAQLDDRELQAQLQNARLDLEIAQNNYKYAQAQNKAMQAAYRRQQELHKYGLGSDAALDEAEFKASGAGFDEDSYRASVGRKQSEIRSLALELEKTRLIAPFSGYVARRYIREGQNVVKNDPCFRLSQLEPLEVRFLVPESAGGRPQPGDPLKVVPVEDSSRTYEARVKLVSPTVDPASGSYDVTAQLTHPDLNRLRPGMAVKVLWPSGRRSVTP
jgi:membrane fusion protein (multidrug efflux system)